MVVAVRRGVTLGPPRGRLSLENQSTTVKQLMTCMKLCVLGMWVFAFIRVLLNALGALTAIVVAIVGTFLLAEDPHCAPLYLRLRVSVMGACCGDGGLRMLLPFLLLSTISGLLDALTLHADCHILGYQKALSQPLDKCVLGTVICDAVSAVLCVATRWCLDPSNLNEGYYQEMPDDFVEQLVLPPVQVNQMGDSRAAGGRPGGGAEGSTRTQPFVAFSGKSYHLPADD